MQFPNRQTSLKQTNRYSGKLKAKIKPKIWIRIRLSFFKQKAGAV